MAIALDAETRKRMLDVAIRLWSELEKNELGGYSGVNRPFWIMNTLVQIYELGVVSRENHGH